MKLWRKVYCLLFGHRYEVFGQVFDFSGGRTKVATQFMCSRCGDYTCMKHPTL